MSEGENIFIHALQELNKHQLEYGECSITFTYHDGRVMFYTVSTNERHNVNSLEKRKDVRSEKSA